MQRLPSFLKLVDARRNKDALFASLTPFEVEVLDIVAKGGRVFGDRPGLVTNGVVVLTIGRQEPKTVEGGQSSLSALARNGWLRFAPSPMNPNLGYFWLTDSAERVWRVLGRKVRDL